MSEAPTKTRSPFGDWLRTRLETNAAAGRKPDSIRSLARAMANGDPDKSRIWKRSLNRWVAGKKPTEASRYIVAEALDVDVAEVPTNASDEEDEELADALAQAIRLVVRRELQRSHA